MSLSRPSDEDEKAIRDLFARYAWAYDCRDYQAVAEAYAEDGVMVAPGEECTGRAAIAAWLEEHVNEFHLDKQMQHHLQHLVLDGGGASCRAWSYWTVIAQVSGGECFVGAFGWYEDQLVKIDADWLIQRRAFHGGMPRGLPWKTAEQA